MTHPLVAHIEALNASRASMAITTDLDHWADAGVTTPEQFDRLMAIDTYCDVYKDRHGIRPRWIDFDALKTDQIEAMLDDI